MVGPLRLPRRGPSARRSPGAASLPACTRQAAASPRLPPRCRWPHAGRRRERPPPHAQPQPKVAASARSPSSFRPKDTSAARGHLSSPCRSGACSRGIARRRKGVTSRSGCGAGCHAPGTDSQAFRIRVRGMPYALPKGDAGFPIVYFVAMLAVGCGGRTNSTMGPGGGSAGTMGSASGTGVASRGSGQIAGVTSGNLCNSCHDAACGPCPDEISSGSTAGSPTAPRGAASMTEGSRTLSQADLLRVLRRTAVVCRLPPAPVRLSTRGRSPRVVVLAAQG